MTLISICVTLLVQLTIVDLPEVKTSTLVVKVTVKRAKLIANLLLIGVRYYWNLCRERREDDLVHWQVCWHP